MKNASDASEVDSSVLITLSMGLGSLAVLPAGVAVYLLLQNHGALTKRKYRRNHATVAREEEPLEQSSH